ncbi:MAG: hypothetical protein O6649_01855, partial [Gammaproteobacteria bacterium]|nr:hypothetical protein [Gammaproteobacteria bacterium]
GLDRNVGPPVSSKLLAFSDPGSRLGGRDDANLGLRQCHSARPLLLSFNREFRRVGYVYQGRYKADLAE